MNELTSSTLSGLGIYPFSLGKLEIGCEGDDIVLIKRVSADTPCLYGNDLTELAFSQIREYLAGTRREFTFPIKLKGTEFQMRVWAQLRKIPYGETRTYKDIAIALSNPKACRAVGMANNKNPIIIAVPCHRVIGSNGTLVGYGGGLDMKEHLLSLEAQYR